MPIQEQIPNPMAAQMSELVSNHALTQLVTKLSNTFLDDHFFCSQHKQAELVKEQNLFQTVTSSSPTYLHQDPPQQPKKAELR